MAATMNCPYCGKMTDPRLDACPHCGVPLRAKPPAPRAKNAAPTPAPRAAGGQHCKNCNAPVRDGDIICSRCGVNLLTGEKISAAAPRDSARTTQYIVGGIIGLAVVAIVAAAVYFILRDPVAEARELARSGNMLEGINVLNAHLSRQQNDAEALKTLGQLYWATQDYPAAAEAFSSAAKLTPENVETGLMSVVAASRLQGELGRGLQQEAWSRLAENHPDNLRLRYMNALALGASGDIDGETAELSAIIESAEAKDYEDDLAIAEALNGDLLSAERRLVAASAGGDTDVAQGLVFGLLNDNDAAMRELTSAVESGTSIQALANVRLGMLYMSQGRFEEALPRLREAKSAVPPVPVADFFYALCLQANGLSSEALLSFDSIAVGKGEYADEAAVQMALLFLEQGDISRAQESLRFAQAAGGESAKLFTIQGKVALAQGELGQAQQSFRMAIANDGDYAPAHLENGLLYIARNQLAEGLDELRRYLELIGPDAQGVRAPEIEMLVRQLQQTVEGGTPSGSSVAGGISAQPTSF